VYIKQIVLRVLLSTKRTGHTCLLAPHAAVSLATTITARIQL
jgi:hypothetical protein